MVRRRSLKREYDPEFGNHFWHYSSSGHQFWFIGSGGATIWMVITQMHQLSTKKSAQVVPQFGW
jgi:hypothetical protein